LLKSGFVFRQIFLPNGAEHLSDLRSGGKEQPGGDLNHAQPRVEVPGFGRLEFVHQEPILGKMCRQPTPPDD
jgi:hypothetical protein